MTNGEGRRCINCRRIFFSMRFGRVCGACREKDFDSFLPISRLNNQEDIDECIKTVCADQLLGK